MVCSAESEKQVQAIAGNIDDSLRSVGERPIGVEGVSSGRWALIDYGDVVVHVFLNNVRMFYDIEGLWSDAPAVSVKDKPQAKKPAVKKAAPLAEKKPVAKKAVKKPAVKKAAAAKKPVSIKGKVKGKAVGKKTPAVKKAATRKTATVKPGTKKPKGE